MAIGSLDNGFQFALFLGQFVKVRIRLGVGGVNLVQLRQSVVYVRDGLVNDFLYGLLLVQFRLLRQVAHIDAGLWPGLTDVILVDTRHNTQQGGFTGAVQTKYADFGAREEAQRDVFQNFPLGRYHLAHAVHGVYVLSHFGIFLLSNSSLKNESTSGD